MTYSSNIIRAALVAGLALVFGGSSALAHMAHRKASDTACDDVALRCASKVTPAFGPDGTLYLLWMAGGRLSVASSKDAGKTYGPPVAVTTKQLDLDWGPDARPKIVVDREGRIIVAFSAFRDKAFNGEVFTTHSSDGGKSFAALSPITSNKESQRFEALALDTDGSVFAAWLDKRGRVPAKKAGAAYDGAGLYFSSSRDGGATYSQARLAQDNTCECCRIAVAFAAPGHPVVAFRNIFPGGIRDHAITTLANLTTPGAVHRISADDWQIAACPHQGPSLAVSAAGTYHVTWYTNGKNRQGLFYARSEDGGKTFSDPLAIGQPDRSPSRPYVLAGSRGTDIVWKEFDGEQTTVKWMTSDDDGRTWSKPRTVASTADTSDHPLLVSDGARVFLSWMTKADGYRFQVLGDGS